MVRLFTVLPPRGSHSKAPVLLADLGISATLSKAKVLKSQQRAKQSPMSMAASLKKEDDRLKVEKSNVLLVGPTGCGMLCLTCNLTIFFINPYPKEKRSLLEQRPRFLTSHSQ